MRAIRVHESGGIDTMRLDEIPRPVPGAGEVLVAGRSRRQPERSRTKPGPERCRSRSRRLARSIDTGAAACLA